MATKEQWAQLRKPFAPDEIELLPRYTGKRNEKGYPLNPRVKCDECGGYHPTPAIHLHYAGHATITDRLNDVDPEWNWEPCAIDEFGNPRISNGGMWIKLTVLGVTRYGYGDAQGKTGHNAVKEIIGDAIRNAAMRFGVGTYLWSKSEKAQHLLENSEGGDVASEAKVTPKPKKVKQSSPTSTTPVEVIEVNPVVEAKERLWIAIQAYCEQQGGDPREVSNGLFTNKPAEDWTLEDFEAKAAEFEGELV